MNKFLAFTLKSNEIMNMLKTDTLVLSDIRNKDVLYTPKLWTGLWDNGASRSSITQRIVDDLSLIPVGSTNISTANGIVTVNTYFVDFGLPNGVTVKNVLVSCSGMLQGIKTIEIRCYPYWYKPCSRKIIKK